jgi:hypothetical protein
MNFLEEMPMLIAIRPAPNEPAMHETVPPPGVGESDDSLRKKSLIDNSENILPPNPIYIFKSKWAWGVKKN